MKILFFLMLFLLISCGKDDSNSKKTVTIVPEQIANLLENQSFECASIDGDQCPAGIARIFILNLDRPTESSLCTGFLTDANRLVTNHHCLSTEEECSNTYISIYNGANYETAKCKDIISAVDDGKPLSEKVIDYAVLELDHFVSSEIFKVSSRTPRIGAKLSAWVIDHITLFEGRITEFECTVRGRKNSLELANCPSISGNSGSPVLNSEGSVVGVLWGATTTNDITERTPLNLRRELENFSYITESRFFNQFARKRR